MRTHLSLKNRLTKAVLINSRQCWLWQNSISQTGYGRLTVGSRTDNTRRTVAAHRASYEAFKGNIPENLTIDHLCKVRSCINPDHLEAVTIQENVRRGNPRWKQEAQQTHCHRGHEYTQENTARYKNLWGTPSRHCKACMRAQAVERWKKSPRNPINRPLSLARTI